jgi:hypothetical protein
MTPSSRSGSSTLAERGLDLLRELTRIRRFEERRADGARFLALIDRARQRPEEP